jgi:hypothetical protein
MIHFGTTKVLAPEGHDPQAVHSSMRDSIASVPTSVSYDPIHDVTDWRLHKIHAEIRGLLLI